MNMGRRNHSRIDERIEPLSNELRTLEADECAAGRDERENNSRPMHVDRVRDFSTESRCSYVGSEGLQKYQSGRLTPECH
jgi:hypothetical protein